MHAPTRFTRSTYGFTQAELGGLLGLGRSAIAERERREARGKKPRRSRRGQTALSLLVPAGGTSDAEGPDRLQSSQTPAKQ